MDHKGLQIYLIDNVHGFWIEGHIHNLAHPDDPYISDIPMSASDYVCEYCHISEEQEQHVALPKKLSLLKQQLLIWHKRLNHFPKKDTFQLFDQGILPPEFFQIKADIPL